MAAGSITWSDCGTRTHRYAFPVESVSAMEVVTRSGVAALDVTRSGDYHLNVCTWANSEFPLVVVPRWALRRVDAL